MDKREKIEILKKLRNQLVEISKQKEVQNRSQEKNNNETKQESENLKKDKQKRLLLIKKDGFINMSLIVELILGITLALGTMSIINTILTKIIK